MHVDACVIGSGASGSVVANELVGRGRSVLLLEAASDEAVTDMARVEPTWPKARIDGGALNGRPWSARARGGGTAFYAGIMFRFRDVDFMPDAHSPQDVMPTGSSMTPDEARPYYDELEQRIGIARSARSDPTEPPGIDPVMPAHRYSRAGALVADAANSEGLRPFPTPLAVNSIPYGGRPACMRLTPCNEHACPSGAKANSANLFLDPLPRPLLELRYGSLASRIEMESPYSARGVEWVDLATQERHRCTAGVVVLAANAIQSAGLLLRSRQKNAPQGIGNRSDVVGRGLCFKASESVVARLPLPLNVSEPQLGPHSTVAIADFYRAESAPLGLGGMIYEATTSDRSLVDGSVLVRLHYTVPDQPQWANRVRIRPSEHSTDGCEVDISYASHPIDLDRLSYLRKQATRVLVAAGAETVDVEASEYQRGSRHLHGGARSGVDPQTSVTDPDGRVHGVENVYVADGGNLPYPSGVNPTFTIQANALRIAREILKKI